MRRISLITLAVPAIGLALSACTEPQQPVAQSSTVPPVATPASVPNQVQAGFGNTPVNAGFGNQPVTSGFHNTPGAPANQP